MKCPCCKGEGGYKEVILDDGTGPYYPCGYCDDNTTVSIFKWLNWFWTVDVYKFWHNLFCTIDERE